MRRAVSRASSPGGYALRISMDRQPRIYSRREVYEVLRERFGHAEFRLGQADVVRSILRGLPTITVLPTGGGKSLCFQLPALLFAGTTIVISPLIALMRDQVMALQSRGIAATSLHSNQDYSERADVERAFVAGELKMLYVSPERLATPRFLELIDQVQIGFVAVDEAHCVVRWGLQRARPFYWVEETYPLTAPIGYARALRV